MSGFESPLRHHSSPNPAQRRNKSRGHDAQRDYELTRKLEKYAGLKPDTDRADRYQNRLEKCLERLGHARTRKFRGYLRKRLYTELCVDLLQSAKEGWKSGDLIPTRIREVAKLGQLANPIVSFNVEMRRWLSVEPFTWHSGTA